MRLLQMINENVKKKHCLQKCIYIFFLIIAISFLQKNIMAAEETLPSGLKYSELSDTVEKYISENSETTVGLSCAVIDEKDIIYEKYYGYSDKENNICVDENSVFEWGSCTKLLVWISVMQLEEKGLIDLDEDIRKYLPKDFLTKLSYDEKITMKNLMNHNAGWQNVITGLFVNEEDNRIDLGDALKMSEPKQVFKPGEVCAYSNWGCALAGYIVECITKQKFYEYVKQNIFEPLEIKHTGLAPDLNDNLWVKEQRKKMQGYNDDGTLIEENVYPLLLYPAGMATGTLKDFIKFASSLVNKEYTNKLFSDKETFKKMCEGTLFYEKTNIKRNCHGFWVIEKGKQLLGHGGRTLSHSAYILFDPDSLVATVIMTNQYYEMVYCDGLANIIYGKYDRSNESSPVFDKIDEIKGTYTDARSIFYGHFKIYSALALMPFNVIDEKSLQSEFLGKQSIITKSSESFLLNNLYTFATVNTDGKKMLQTEYGDYIEMNDKQVILYMVTLVLLIINIVYSVIMFIVHIINMIKKRKFICDISHIQNFVQCICLIIFVINLYIFISKVSIYVLPDSYIINVIIFLALLIVSSIQILIVILRLKKYKTILKRIIFLNILTVISAIILILNVIVWELYVL